LPLRNVGEHGTNQLGRLERTRHGADVNYVNGKVRKPFGHAGYLLDPKWGELTVSDIVPVGVVLAVPD